MSMKLEAIIKKVTEHYNFDINIHICKTYLDVIYKASQKANVKFNDAYLYLQKTYSNPDRYLVERELDIDKLSALAYENNIYFNKTSMEKETEERIIKTILHELYHTFDKNVTAEDSDIRADKYAEKEFNTVWRHK